MLAVLCLMRSVGCSQLTDELIRGKFGGIETLQQLREAFSVATAAQREQDQRDKVHEALIKVSPAS